MRPGELGQERRCALWPVCLDYEEKPLMICTGCKLAVHAECYSVPHAASFTCDFCLAGRKGVCIFCPMATGALKQTTNQRWVHLICTHCVEYASLGDQGLVVVDPEFFAIKNHHACHVCVADGQASKARQGVCLQCAALGCDRTFHATCAQEKHLLTLSNDQTEVIGYCGAHSKSTATAWNANGKAVKVECQPEGSRSTSAVQRKPQDVQVTSNVVSRIKPVPGKPAQGDVAHIVHLLESSTEQYGKTRTLLKELEIQCRKSRAEAKKLAQEAEEENDEVVEMQQVNDSLVQAIDLVYQVLGPDTPPLLGNAEAEERFVNTMSTALTTYAADNDPEAKLSYLHTLLESLAHPE